MFGGGAGFDGAEFLEYDGAVVVVFVYVVDGDAAVGFAGRYNGLVYVVSVHAFAAKLGQECWVYVDDLVREGGYPGGGYLP